MLINKFLYQADLWTMIEMSFIMVYSGGSLSVAISFLWRHADFCHFDQPDNIIILEPPDGE